ncbi:hypothetical protein NQZ68_009108 [Dissostichus eleginoides]|nr:hypothetical protein NQZ68_009108 [Dissostichus eleginoides]
MAIGREGTPPTHAHCFSTPERVYPGGNYVVNIKKNPKHLDLFFSVPGLDCAVYGSDGQTQTGQATET